MPRKTSFIHKLLNRLDRVDTQTAQRYFQDLADGQALLAQILDELPDAVAVFSLDGRVQYSNQTFLDAFQLRESDLKNRPRLKDLVEDASLTDWVQSHLETSEIVTLQLKLLQPREWDVKITLKPLHDSCLVMAVIQTASAPDWDEHKTGQLESLIRLSAGIAHEIGNPLNSIAIHLNLLKKQCGELADAKRRTFDKHLSVIQSETERLDHIIKSFLKATRKPPLRFKLENLNAIVQGALDFMQPELEHKGIKIRFLPDRSLPDALMDRERLHQAFINLLKNAMEAMRSGVPGTIHLKVDHRSKAVWVRIKDNGQGIKEKDLPHIFDAYFTTKSEGSGLGLMTVYNIIREHGGRIEVTSKTGQGTEFVLFLPLRLPKLQLPAPHRSGGAS